MTDPSNNRDTSTAPVDFERALRSLVLEAFAEGVAIEGAWEVTSPSALVPNWRVTVEKITDAEVAEDRVFLND